MSMRAKTAQWYICKIRYEKVLEDGLQKKVTESYVIDALCFAEAEKRIIHELEAYISGDFEVIDISRAQFKETFFNDASNADRWYSAKLEFVTIDEVSEKEKRSTVTYLVQAGTFDEALKSINEIMGGTMIDYVTAKIEETKIMDVFEYSNTDDEKEHQ